MSLDESHVQQFRRDGFTIVNDFFTSRETRALQLDVQRLQDQGLLRNVRTTHDGKTTSAAKLNLQLCPVSPHSMLVKSLPFDEKVMAAVTRLIGSDVMLHLDQIFLKPGLRGTGTNWHQDNAYFKIKNPLQGTAMWIAVHDATIANGTMRLIPGLFDQSLAHERDPESDHHIRCYPDEMKSVAAEVSAGSVVFFCYGTPHCTMGNNTLEDRAGLAFHFLTYEAARTGASHENFQPGRDCRPALTGSEATAGLSEYGQDMTDVFNQTVQSILQTTHSSVAG
jgi:ectoine hydroxylase-related dioxygenase (phytanoyl-CoA dioxygenase family)